MSVNRQGDVLHFKFGDADKAYKMDGRSFDSLEQLITFYYETGARLAGKQDVELLTPVLNTLDLIDYQRLQFVQELGRVRFSNFF